MPTRSWVAHARRRSRPAARDSRAPGATVHLAVVGEFSSGKFLLAERLTRQDPLRSSGRVAGLLATDINPSTATITELEYGASESALAKYPSGRTERIPLEGSRVSSRSARTGRARCTTLRPMTIRHHHS